MKIKEITIDFLGHSGFIIQDSSGKRIAIDPYNISGNIPPADIILITHSHYDHCSIKDLTKLAKPGASIIVPADAQSKITRIDKVNMEIIEIGDELSLGNIKIEAVPAYNIKKDFHPKKEQWLGYLIKINGTVIYHAGDTDKIPEMEKLTGYGKHDTQFITLLPVSGKYVMTAEEAAEVASLLKPNLAIPMHYGAGVIGTREDAERFQKLCFEKNINAEILEKI
jgi:L-ascorbate metabolism protein UlaG (beta-lactamase superfamily)